jgi:hypothetical protein
MIWERCCDCNTKQCFNDIFVNKQYVICNLYIICNFGNKKCCYIFLLNKRYIEKKKRFHLVETSEILYCSGWFFCDCSTLSPQTFPERNNPKHENPDSKNHKSDHKLAQKFYPESFETMIVSLIAEVRFGLVRLGLVWLG